MMYWAVIWFTVVGLITAELVRLVKLDHTGQIVSSYAVPDPSQCS
jgi:hypothetical protein